MKQRRSLSHIALALLLCPLALARHHTRHPSGAAEAQGGQLSDGVTSTDLHYNDGSLLKELHPPPTSPQNVTVDLNLPICHDFGRTGKFTGQWVDHPDRNFRGLYDQHSACPKWAHDFDCDTSAGPSDKNPALLASEYRKVFQPDECNLRPWDTQGFDTCMKGRRIIFVGDSMTWQMYTSLACLLAPVTETGVGVTWEKSNTTVTGEYKGREWNEGRHIMKQYWAQVKLKNGGELIARCFGRFNGTLWDDVFAELGPLTERDVIIVNFGAWYPRFNYYEIRTPFEAYKQDVREIFMEKLAKSPAQTIWRINSPSHFGGHTGTFTAIEQMLMPEGVPKRQHCDPVTVGEYWFRDAVLQTLKECGEPCKKIKLLPVFDLSLARHNSHHGSFGRGRDVDMTDCRHFCLNVIDWWNILLYSMMCFP